MIKITFPDGSVREYESGVTGLQIAESISSRLAQDVLACGVNGETVEAVTTEQGSYIEASHIGTQSLAVAAVFTISDGSKTYTYSASPMTYVYTVNEAATNAVITEELKDACAALYYYYSAVAECFNLGFDTTGFLTVGTLRVLTDTVNSFSAPRFIVIA